MRAALPRVAALAHFVWGVQVVVWVDGYEKGPSFYFILLP
jgi:hypothetical protein